MKVRQGNMLTALESTRRFLDDNQAALVGVMTPATRQTFDDAIGELSSTAMAQNQFTRDLKGSFAVQAACRTALIRNHMTPIAKIATLELSQLPELVQFSLPHRRVTIQQLGAHADGMAEGARPYAQVFIDAGRRPDFIDRLKQAADQMRAAAYDAAQGRVRIKGTTTGLTQTLSRARKIVQMLDAFVKEAAGNDKALLDSWHTAKRVVRTSGASRASTTVGSTPAATTPATTPMSGAKTANSGSSSVVSVGDSSSAAIRVGTHALALRARLAQKADAGPLTEHGGEPLSARDDPTVSDRAVGRFDRQLTLAFVQIQAYDLHDGGPPGMRPVGRR